MTQDQLYKDAVRVERAYIKKEESLKDRMRQYENLIQEEKEKYQKVETALQALSTNNHEAIQNKVIDLTK